MIFLFAYFATRGSTYGARSFDSGKYDLMVGMRAKIQFLEESIVQLKAPTLLVPQRNPRESALAAFRIFGGVREVA